MKDIESLVTPSEAVELFEMASGAVLLAAKAVAEAYVAAHDDGGDWNAVDQLCLMGCIWNAGRIQGVRDERRMRKEKKLAAEMHQKPIARAPIGGGRTVPLFTVGDGYIDTAEGWKLYGAYLDAKRAYDEGKKAFYASRDEAKRKLLFED